MGMAPYVAFGLQQALPLHRHVLQPGPRGSAAAGLPLMRSFATLEEPEGALPVSAICCSSLARFGSWRRPDPPCSSMALRLEAFSVPHPPSAANRAKHGPGTFQLAGGLNLKPASEFRPSLNLPGLPELSSSGVRKHCTLNPAAPARGESDPGWTLRPLTLARM